MREHRARCNIATHELQRLLRVTVRRDSLTASAQRKCTHRHTGAYRDLRAYLHTPVPQTGLTLVITLPLIGTKCQTACYLSTPTHTARHGESFISFHTSPSPSPPVRVLEAAALRRHRCSDPSHLTPPFISFRVRASLIVRQAREYEIIDLGFEQLGMQ